VSNGAVGVTRLMEAKQTWMPTGEKEGEHRQNKKEVKRHGRRESVRHGRAFLCGCHKPAGAPLEKRRSRPREIEQE